MPSKNQQAEINTQRSTTLGGRSTSWLATGRPLAAGPRADSCFHAGLRTGWRPQQDEPERIAQPPERKQKRKLARKHRLQRKRKLARKHRTIGSAPRRG